MVTFSKKLRSINQKRTTKAKFLSKLQKKLTQLSPYMEVSISLGYQEFRDGEVKFLGLNKKKLTKADLNEFLSEVPQRLDHIAAYIIATLSMQEG